MRASARTLVEKMGPANQVTGASTTPTSVPDVFESRFAPWGTFTAPEKKGLWKWAMAQAGQAVNQTCWAGSPQSHVMVADGCPLQTCHHRMTPGTANSAIASRWRPTRRAARPNRDEPSEPVGRSVATAGSSNIVVTAAGAYRQATAARMAVRGRSPGDSLGRRRPRRAGLPNICVVPGTVEKVGTVGTVGTSGPTPSCVVVGAGLLGLSAAWALARRGAAVVVLEAGEDVGHERSGSKGDARIFRLGYPERLYVEMALQARELWAELEARSGRALLHVTGQVAFGAEVESISAAMEAAGAPFERLSTRDLAARFPGIDTDGPALFEADSGVLAAGSCLRALRDDADFEVRTGVSVTSLRNGDGDVAVRTAAGDEFRADVVVDCAGPGALSLLAAERPAGSVTTGPSLPQVAYFRAVDRPDDGSGLPVFIEWGPDMIYGLPVPASSVGDPGIYKVSHHTSGTPLGAFDPSKGDPLAGDDPSLLALLTSAVTRLLPGLDPEPVATERCVYDDTYDSDFVIDRIGNVVLGCGTSGHGFKFGPLLGEMMADLAIGSDDRPTRPRPDPGRPAPFRSRSRRPLWADRADQRRRHRPFALRGWPTPVGCPTVPRYVALLRSVNVAGHGRIAMNELRASFAALGFGDVLTYIQTGNVLFKAPSKSESALAAAIEQQLADDFGDSPAVLLRTVPDLLRIGNSSPYAKAGANPARHHVTFLDHAPPDDVVASLALPPSRNDELHISGREVFVHTPDGYAGTKLTGTFLERRLGVVSTTRNWNTVTKLCGLAGR